MVANEFGGTAHNVYSGPWTEVTEGDRKLVADAYASLLNIFVARSGVVDESSQGSGDAMQVGVTTPQSRAVLIQPGNAILGPVGGLASGMRQCGITSAYTQPIGQADATNPRIDVVGLRVRDNTFSDADDGRAIGVHVLPGTPARSPAVPTFTTTVNETFLPLAQVRVPAGATTISAANITDVRVFSDPFAQEDFDDDSIPASAVSGLDSRNLYFFSRPITVGPDGSYALSGSDFYTSALFIETREAPEFLRISAVADENEDVRDLALYNNELYVLLYDATGDDVIIRKYSLTDGTQIGSDIVRSSTDNAYAIAVNASGIYFVIGGTSTATLIRLDASGTQLALEAAGSKPSNYGWQIGLAADSTNVYSSVGSSASANLFTEQGTRTNRIYMTDLSSFAAGVSGMGYAMVAGKESGGFYVLSGVNIDDYNALGNKVQDLDDFSGQIATTFFRPSTFDGTVMFCLPASRTYERFFDAVGYRYAEAETNFFRNSQGAEIERIAPSTLFRSNGTHWIRQDTGVLGIANLASAT